MNNFTSGYYLVVLVTTLLMLITYVCAQHKQMTSFFLELDSTDSLLYIKTWAVKLFIPLFIFNTLFYVIPAALFQFSIFAIGYLIIVAILWKRIKQGWTEKGNLPELFTRIEGDSYVRDVLMLYVGVGTFFSCLVEILSLY